MLTSLKQLIDFTYEGNATGSYLVAEVSADEKIQEYQVEMIANNYISYILPLSLRRKNNSINLQYNITSKQVLSQFLKRRKLKRNEFIGILQSVTNAILDCKNYLLTDKYFLLEEDYMYINPGTLELSLVYMPIVIETEVIKNIKDFLINFILHTADIDENVSDNFLQKILSYAKSENFNVVDFDVLLKSLKFEQLASDNNFNVNSHVVSENIMEEQQKSTTHKAPSNTQTKENSSKKSKNIIAITLGAVVNIGIVAIFALNSEFLETLNDDIVATWAGIGILLLSVNFLAYRWISGKEELTAKESTKGNVIKHEKTPVRNIEIPGKVTVNVPEQTTKSLQAKETVPRLVTKKANVKKQHSDNSDKGLILELPIQNSYKPEILKEVKSDPAELFPENLNETVFIGFQKGSYPCLRRMENGVVEEITIDKSNFIIGRLKGQVDYVSHNNTIGKIHAEIISRDGAYFIKDLNSKNGTYINDERIESNREYQILHNFKITFANIEYIVVIP